MKILWVLAAVAAFVFAGLGLGVLWLNHHPDKLRATIETQLQNRLEHPVSLDGAEARLLGGLRLTLSGLRVGEPGNLRLQAARVEASLASWQLLRGDIVITRLKMIQAALVLPEGALAGSGDGPDLPAIELQRSSLEFTWHRRTFSIRDITGTLGPDRIEFTARCQEARLQVHARRVRGRWEGHGAVSALPLALWMPQMRGMVDLRLEASRDSGATRLALEALANGVELPWCNRTLQQAALSVQGRLARRRLTLSRLQLQTEVISLAGSAQVAPLLPTERLPEAELKLELRGTETVDYEAAVACLPLDTLPPWLRDLLGRQVRSGRIDIERIGFDGPFGQLRSAETFFEHAQIRGRLSGLSFASRPQERRIEAIQGAGSYQQGRLAFTELAATIGSSRIEDVSLAFANLTGETDTQLHLEAAVDMEASDFAAAWRAAMVSEQLRQMLAPLQKLTAGRISGQAECRSSLNGGTFQIRGEAQLEQGSFFWDRTRFDGISATAACQDFDDPLQISLAGRIAGCPVESLQVTLQDPFGEADYRFTLRSIGFPWASPLNLAGDADVRFRGEGRGPDLHGDIALEAQGLTVAKSFYKPASGIISGQGRFSASLGPEPEFQLSRLQLVLEPGTVLISAEVHPDHGQARFSGILNLVHMQTITRQGVHPFSGRLAGQVALSWGARLQASGQIHCDGVKAYYGDVPVALDGSLALEERRIEAEQLTMQWGETAFILQGALDLRKTPHYRGNIRVADLDIGAHTTAGEGWLQKFSADALIEIARVRLYGVRFERGNTRLRLHQGRVTLEELHLEGPSGRIAGGLELAPEGKGRCELQLDLVDSGPSDFINTLRGESGWINGKMRLQGKLRGQLQALDGRLAYHAEDGRIRESSLLSKIFGLLNVYKLIRSADPALMSKDFAYNDISVSFEIEKGRMHFEDFTLDSNSLQLHAVGDYEIDSDAIDAVVGVQPLETLDKAISLLPYIGWVITGDEGRLIVVHMRVRGKLADPEIAFAPVDTISRPVVDIFKRVFKTPATLLDKTRKLIPGGQKGVDSDPEASRKDGQASD